MGANVKRQGINALYVKAGKGKLYYNTDPKDPNHIMETWTNKDGEEKKRYITILEGGLSGKIVKAEYRKGKYGSTFCLLLEDNGYFELQLKPGTFDLDSFINQLMCVDPSKNVSITASEEVSGKYTNTKLWLRYEASGELAGFKYSKKKGNADKVPGKGTKTNDEGEEVNDWSPVHAFYAKWIKNEFGPLLENTNGKDLENNESSEAYIPEEQTEEETEAEVINQPQKTTDPIIDADADDLPF